MEKIKPLGLLLKDGKGVNHRSLTKIVLNPILRMFSIELGSKFIDNKFQNYIIKKCSRKLNIIKNYYDSIFTCNEYDEVINERKI